MTHILIQDACTLWANGEVVAIPTETVYGLAADAEQDDAVAKIFAIKGRPQFNPLIIHGYSLRQLSYYVEITPLFEKLAAAFWPGPLTIVGCRKKEASLSYLVSAGLDTVAVRIPAHPVALELLKAYRKPLAAPSANKSNTISPTSAADVAASLKKAVPLIIDGGLTTVGVESTIIDITGPIPTILRPGGTTYEDLTNLIGKVQYATADSEIKAPGMLKRHYAPSLPLHLNRRIKQEGEVLLGFGDTACDLNLSKTGCLQEAAANLFRMMRELDTISHHAIAVAPIPHIGLGVAINDRLQRAAASPEEPIA